MPESTRTAPLYDFVIWAMDALNIYSVIAFFIISTLLPVIQGLILTDFLDKQKLFIRVIWIPAFALILLTGLIPEMAAFGPELISLTFLVLIFKRLMHTFRKERCDRDLFDIGFFLALAMLFYPLTFIFVLFVFIAIILLRPLKLKEILIFLTGVLVPYFLTWTIVFGFGLDYALLNHFSELLVIDLSFAIDLDLIAWIQIGILVFASFVGFFMMQSQYNTFTIQVRTFLNITLVYTLVAMISLIWSTPLAIVAFLPVCLSLSIYMIKLIRDIRWPILAELIHVFLLLGSAYRILFM